MWPPSAAAFQQRRRSPSRSLTQSNHRCQTTLLLAGKQVGKDPTSAILLLATFVDNAFTNCTIARAAPAVVTVIPSTTAAASITACATKIVALLQLPSFSVLPPLSPPTSNRRRHAIATAPSCAIAFTSQPSSIVTVAPLTLPTRVATGQHHSNRTE
ncbi:hypothetical protein GW17_00038319 [Ensete ventricosum]|nr:hypothetical protein GW17_00038319 [Ensete ventricosum]RZR93996.1 hypothetical protein BHM03_00022600 [Ensete ventricosum]